jgi:hypothetical protein
MLNLDTANRWQLHAPSAVLPWMYLLLPLDMHLAKRHNNLQPADHLYKHLSLIWWNNACANKLGGLSPSSRKYLFVLQPEQFNQLITRTVFACSITYFTFPSANEKAFLCKDFKCPECLYQRFQFESTQFQRTCLNCTFSSCSSLTF